MRIPLSPCLLIPLSLFLLAQTSPPAPDPAKSLAAHFAALKETRNLEACFLCEKRLAALETPLVSNGRLWIRRGDPHEDGPSGGAVRFTTEKPYVSELILARGQVLVRSQHEKDWTKTNQSARPGLGTVMSQLGSWSTGDPGKLTDMYAISAGAQGDAAIPLPPSDAVPQPRPSDNFVLTPTNKDLLKAVKKITISIGKESHHLQFIEILTQQDDATRYWFYDVKTSINLPADIFTPTSSSITNKTSPASASP